MPERTIPTEEALHDRLHSFSHGSKNRLAALWEVIRHLHAASEDETSKALMEHAERAYFGAQRDLEQLMDDLQVDRAIRPAPFTPVQANELIRQAVERNVHRFSKKTQTLEVEPTDATVMTDVHWCVAILDALLSNASKFSPRGSSIRVIPMLEKDRLAIQVMDTGVGLHAEDLDQVFVRYALLHSRSTDGEQQMRGTLGRCRQWAQALGGSLHAASPGEGKGATFTLYVPIAS